MRLRYALLPKKTTTYRQEPLSSCRVRRGWRQIFNYGIGGAEERGWEYIPLFLSNNKGQGYSRIHVRLDIPTYLFFFKKKKKKEKKKKKKEKKRKRGVLSFSPFVSMVFCCLRRRRHEAQAKRKTVRNRKDAKSQFRSTGVDNMACVCFPSASRVREVPHHLAIPSPPISHLPPHLASHQHQWPFSLVAH